MLQALLDNSLFVLFAAIAVGLLVGRVNVGGLSLGSSAVIFVALVLGHFGADIPDGVGTVGLVFFVYCVGITAGPGFFRAFAAQGKALTVLVAVTVAVAAAATVLVAHLFTVPADLAVGIFAGGLTSTPALAAAREWLPAGSNVAVGYGIGYPFGVVGVVIFVQLVPRLLRADLAGLSRELSAAPQARQRIVRALVEVVNPGVIGRRLGDIDFVARSGCQVSRQLRDDRLVPVPANLVLDAGQHLLVVGLEFNVNRVVTLLGRPSDRTDCIMDTERQRMRVVVSARDVVGRSLAELKVRTEFGVTISRITRHDLEFVPDADDVIQYGDSLHAVGEPDDLERFAKFAGHREKSFDETDLISLAIGILAGILLGLVSFELGGTRLSLGLAGGPLVVALLLGHFGRIGPVVGSLPRASRLLMMELGLVLFLCDAGVKAGGSVVPVIQQHGLSLCLAAAVITALPLVAGYVVGRRLLGMNLLQVLGGACGGMTSTPGLGAVTAKVDSDVPVVSYAAAYPVALVLITIVAPMLVSILSRMVG
jgi:putative transport protein